jgi:hypothetical protein
VPIEVGGASYNPCKSDRVRPSQRPKSSATRCTNHTPYRPLLQVLLISLYLPCLPDDLIFEQYNRQLYSSIPMSLSRRVPSTALLSSFYKTPYASCRVAVGRQVRWDSTQNEKPQGHGKSFSGQLYSSTALRLQREKADRERFSKARNEAGGGKSLALTFGKGP